MSSNYCVVFFTAFLLTVCFSGIDGRVTLPFSGIADINAFAEGCLIHISGDLGQPQPLILDPATGDFLYPTNSSGILQLNAGQQIQLYCSAAFYTPPITTNFLTATCSSDLSFIIEDKEYLFSSINCTAYPYHTARKTGNTCNYGEAIEIEIGFDLSDGRFLSLLDVCHDEILESNLYVHYKMTPANNGYQTSFPRPSWITGSYFDGKDVDHIYTNVNQLAVVTKILGSAELAEKFIQPTTTEIYLARGHLAAKVDMIYGAQQRATFWFLNVAPQWQKFNAGNWERIESSTRKFVANRNIDVDMYSGTFGVMTLPDINSVRQEIFLYLDENNNGKIPVPKIYYRVIYEPATKSAIVIIGVNNFHASLEEIEERYIFCTDVSDQISWLNWTPDSLILGYSYACEFNEFAAVVGHLPALEVNNLLI